MNEERRQRFLDESGFLDDSAIAELDELIQAAASEWDVPIALVSLLDRDRQFFKSCMGLPDRETGRDVAFCAHTILGREPFVILNATEDPHFATNPLVTGAPHIRFYAGAPISVNGFTLGSFCIIDSKPRAAFSSAQKQRLQSFADTAARMLEKTRLVLLSDLPLQEQLKLAHTQREQSDAELDKVLSMLGHQLRAPLNSIQGFAELLLQCPEQSLSSGTVKEYAEIIRDSAQVVHRTVENGLRFAVTDFAHMPTQKTRFEVLEVVHTAAQDARVDVDTTALSPWRVTADRDHFYQVFTTMFRFFDEAGITQVKAFDTVHNGAPTIAMGSRDGQELPIDDRCFQIYKPSVDDANSRSQGCNYNLVYADRLLRLHSSGLHAYPSSVEARALALTLPPLSACKEENAPTTLGAVSAA